MARAIAAPLRLLRTGGVRAQAAPLLAVELFAHARLRLDDVALFEFVRRGGLRAWRGRMRTGRQALIEQAGCAAAALHAAALTAARQLLAVNGETDVLAP